MGLKRRGATTRAAGRLYLAAGAEPLPLAPRELVQYHRWFGRYSLSLENYGV